MPKNKMPKLLKEEILTSPTAARVLRISLSCLITTISVLLASAIFPEIAAGSKFDIDAGIKAATDPLIQAVGEHWGKAVLLTGCAGAVIGEGDARQRAVRAGITVNCNELLTPNCNQN